MAQVKIDNSEQRREERFNLELPARVCADSRNDMMELMTKDVCSGGAFFHTETPLEPGTDLEIELVLPIEKIKEMKSQKVHVRLKGAVIRTDSEGMAVCFDKKFSIIPFEIAVSEVEGG